MKMVPPSYTELKKALDAQRQALKDLATRRHGILMQLETLDTEIEQISGMSVQAAIESINEEWIDTESAIQELKADIQKLDQKKRAARKGSLTNIVLDLLEKRRDGLTAMQIKEHVVKTGYKTKAKDIQANVNSALKKMRDRGDIRFDKQTKHYFPRR